FELISVSSGKHTGPDGKYDLRLVGEQKRGWALPRLRLQMSSSAPQPTSEDSSSISSSAVVSSSNPVPVLSRSWEIDPSAVSAERDANHYYATDQPPIKKVSDVQLPANLAFVDWAEIEKHTSKQSGWLVIDRFVYD